MKKTINKIILLISTALLLSGCFNSPNPFNSPFSKETTSINYDEYMGFSNGFSVVAWTIENGEWRCGIYEYPQRYRWIYPNHSQIMHMQSDIPCTLEKMKSILKTYDDEIKKDVIIFGADYPFTKESNVYYEPNLHNTYLRDALGLDPVDYPPNISFL